MNDDTAFLNAESGAIAVGWVACRASCMALDRLAEAVIAGSAGEPEKEVNILIKNFVFDDGCDNAVHVEGAWPDEIRIRSHRLSGAEARQSPPRRFARPNTAVLHAAGRQIQVGQAARRPRVRIYGPRIANCHSSNRLVRHRH